MGGRERARKKNGANGENARRSTERKCREKKGKIKKEMGRECNGGPEGRKVVKEEGIKRGGMGRGCKRRS